MYYLYCFWSLIILYNIYIYLFIYLFIYLYMLRVMEFVVYIYVNFINIFYDKELLRIIK